MCIKFYFYGEKIELKKIQPSCALYRGRGMEGGEKGNRGYKRGNKELVRREREGDLVGE